MSQSNSMWNVIDATVDSAEQFNSTRNSPRGWRIKYSYRVKGHLYRGDCLDYSSKDPVIYHKGGSLPIEYLVARPEKSRVPGARTFLAWARLPWMIALGIALLFIGIRYLIYGHI